MRHFPNINSLLVSRSTLNHGISPQTLLHPGPRSSSHETRANTQAIPTQQWIVKDPQSRLTKKDKRAVKHNTLMSRVKDAGITKSTSKRRRPAKKLQAAEGLGDDLRDALPDVAGAGDEGDDDDGWEGFSDVENQEDDGTSLNGMGLRKRRRRKAAKQDSKMVMRSLTHRPGAMKRKHQMHQREVERFGKNLAQLTGEPKAGVVAGTTADGQSAKWAALRNFINSTMEQDAAFAAR